MTQCTVTEFTESLEEMGLSNDARLFAFQLFAWSQLSDVIQTLAKKPDIILDNLLKCLKQWVQRFNLGENKRAFQISNPQ
jgi:hypothetical protein